MSVRAAIPHLICLGRKERELSVLALLFPLRGQLHSHLKEVPEVVGARKFHKIAGWVVKTNFIRVPAERGA